MESFVFVFLKVGKYLYQRIQNSILCREWGIVWINI